MIKYLVEILLLSCITWFFFNHDATALNNSEPITSQQSFTEQQHQPLPEVSFNDQVKPVLDSRCVVCHSCYDSPCQLKLSSFAGLDRGASKNLVYDPERLEKISPTRLFIDALDTTEWRKKEFYSVLGEPSTEDLSDLNQSILARLLKLKQDNPLADSGKLDATFELDIERDLQCPTQKELPEFEQNHPHWGMPFAMPALSEDNQRILLTWIQQGAKKPAHPAISDQARLEIDKWERFFNGSSFKQKLVARYIYEHLYIGHLHFQNHSDNEFYKLVRSYTPAGETINEIPTNLPYEDPGETEFYYRMRPITSTIVDKNHFVYELSDERMHRYQELFFKPEYRVTALPSYQLKSAANPFKTFIEIPVKSRYQFLLDESQYFFSGFIKGPVCRGQVAINVIRDQFWVAFIDPDLHFSDKSNDYLAKQTEALNMPGSSGHTIGLMEWFNYGELAHNYLKIKDRYLNKNLLQDKGASVDFIWDGDKVNNNASLTVFRHFNSATVTKGFVGNIPLTGWIVDYATFERIHYLLVASFDVYGSLAHQVAIRTYMDYVRMDAENNFLRFIPAKHRQVMHDSWYQSIDAKLFNIFRKPYFSIDHETDVSFKTTDYKSELFEQIRLKLGQAALPKDIINQCTKLPCIRINATELQQSIDTQMQTLARFKGVEIQALPEVTFIRIETEIPENDPVYTLFVNTALSSLSSLYGENLRRMPERDTVTVIPGLIGSYPNFFFSIKKHQLSEFIDALRNAHTEPQKELLYSKFGVRRSNPKIWQLVDWFHQKYQQDNGLHSGLFDLNRYKNL